MNAPWHRIHRMPKRPSLERRLQWYLEHDVHCGCRRMPAWAKTELLRRCSTPARGRILPP